MRTCEFPKSSKPTSIHNSSLLCKNVRDLKTDAFLLTLPMAMPPSVNVSIVVMRTVPEEENMVYTNRWPSFAQATRVTARDIDSMPVIPGKCGGRRNRPGH